MGNNNDQTNATYETTDARTKHCNRKIALGQSVVKLLKKGLKQFYLHETYAALNIKPIQTEIKQNAKKSVIEEDDHNASITTIKRKQSGQSVNRFIAGLTTYTIAVDLT